MSQTDFKSTPRTLDPAHSTKIPILEKALAVLGKRVMIATEDKVAKVRRKFRSEGFVPPNPQLVGLSDFQ
ncbi:MAG: hypothetical protein V3R37_09270 [Rhodospirillales bacterium]